MPRKSSSGSFEAVNPEWLYGIAAGSTPVYIDPQTDGSWLAHTGKTAILILPSDLVVRLLNEALEQGMKVMAVHIESKRALVFEMEQGVVKQSTFVKA